MIHQTSIGCCHVNYVTAMTDAVTAMTDEVTAMTDVVMTAGVTITTSRCRDDIGVPTTSADVTTLRNRSMRKGRLGTEGQLRARSLAVTSASTCRRRYSYGRSDTAYRIVSATFGAIPVACCPAVCDYLGNAECPPRIWPRSLRLTNRMPETDEYIAT